MAEGKTPFSMKPLPIPRNFQRIEPAALADLIQKKEASLTVFDVRDADYTGGHVPGSIHIPYAQFEEKAAEMAKQYGARQHVIFYCMYGQLRSPASALNFIKHLPKSEDAESNNVYVLSGGFHDYLHRYKSNAALVENFDAQAWTADGMHVNDTNLSSVRLRPELQKK